MFNHHSYGQATLFWNYFSKKNIEKQSWTSDITAATTWPCFQAILFINALCLHSLWLLCSDTEAMKVFQMFACHWCSITLSRCRCCADNKLPRAQLCDKKREFDLKLIWALALEAAIQVDADLLVCACVILLQTLVNVDAGDEEVAVACRNNIN